MLGVGRKEIECKEKKLGKEGYGLVDGDKIGGEAKELDRKTEELEMMLD